MKYLLVSILVAGLPIFDGVPKHDIGEDLMIPAEIITNDFTELLVVDFETLKTVGIGESVSLFSSTINLATIPRVEEKVGQLEKWKQALELNGLTRFSVVSYAGIEHNGVHILLINSARKDIDLESTRRLLSEMPKFPFDDYLRSRVQLLEVAQGEPKQLGRWSGWIIGKAEWSDFKPSETKRVALENLIKEIGQWPIFGATIPNETFRTQLSEYLDSVQAGASMGWQWQGILAQWKISLPDTGGSFSVELGENPRIRWASQGGPVDFDERLNELAKIVGRSQNLFPFFLVLFPNSLKLYKTGQQVILEFDKDVLTRSIGIWLMDSK